MTDKPNARKTPPIEPAPVVAPAAAVTPPAPPAPPTVDPYAPAAPYASAYPTGQYGAPQPPKGLAIAALITGIAGVFFSLFYGFGFLPSLAAVITGHLARKRQPYARGMWLAGLICGYTGLGIALLWIVGIIIFVVFLAANHGNLHASTN